MTPNPLPADFAQPKLPLRTKVIYGLGDWPTSAATTARNLYWLFFLVSVVGLSADLAGIAILVGRIWDSINDPLIGMLSDRLQTRWGRRRPFLLFAAVPFGLSFVLLFVVPPFDRDTYLVIYYAVSYLLFDTVYTLINVPYAALTPELTEDYDERSSLAGWRIAIAILANLTAAATFKLMAEELFAPRLVDLVGHTDALRLGYSLSAAVWGISMAIPPLILFKNIREPQRVPPDTDPIRPWQTFKEVFSNRPFRLGATIYLLTFSTVDIVVTVMVWFLIFYVRVDRGWDSLVLAIVLGIALIAMPLTVKAAQRLGKRNAYIGSMAIFAVALVIISQVPPGGQNYIIVAAMIAGLGYGAANVIPWAMVADVVEEDELKTGKRREGIYAGYLVFFRKMATALTLFLVTQVLALTGFQAGTTGGQYFEQPASALLALRILVGIVPGLMLVLAIIVAWRYPLDRATHNTMRELARRRSERQSPDPEP
jgi:glycoside/pentoside/hexuronide:cation symporter, GPH family